MIRNRRIFILLLFFFVFLISSCNSKAKSKGETLIEKNQECPFEEIETAVNFVHFLDFYKPQKEEYNFYFTYKNVHPWWDAVAIGLEDAVRQYENRAVKITYDYLAPPSVSAEYQIKQILSAAASKEYDVIVVDVADIPNVTPVINQVMKEGQKVMTFSSSDSGKENGCNRIAYVGNTHNFEDGADIARVLCEKINYKGKLALLIGTHGAPCHEERLAGVLSIVEKYPDIEIVDEIWDRDDIPLAYDFAKKMLEEHPDLAGFICCNMNNPVAAARAVIAAGKTDKIVIVGIDHHQEALHYLKDGIIYALAVQDCYSMGFDTIQVAIKIADGLLPGSEYPEMTEESTTVIFQKDAANMLQSLYGEIE